MPSPVIDHLSDTGSLDDIDVTALAADIGADILGETVSDNPIDPMQSKPAEKPSGSEKLEGETAPEKPSAEGKPEGEKPAGEIVSGTNSVIKPLPKSWKKEMAPVWEKADPALHEYVYAREADVMRGIQQYQDGYKQWSNLIQPFSPLLQQYPDVSPVQLMQGLMNAHLQLLNPSAPMEKKVEFAKALLQEYGIDLSGVMPPEVATILAEFNALKAEHRTLKQGLARREEEAYTAGVAEQERLVAAFAADPKNQYFDEVANDIFHFIKTGAADDLPRAYELACWANPAVRAKILAQQAAPKPDAVQQPPRDVKGKFVNVESSADVAIKNRKPNSIDATIDAVVASHYTKH